MKANGQLLSQLLVVALQPAPWVVPQGAPESDP